MQSQENKYKAYLLESYNRHCYDHDHGFVHYSIINTHCIIHNIYVDPEKRQSRIASEMADKIVEIAKKEGATNLICEIDKRNRTFNAAVAAILGYGFNLIDESQFYLTFHKDI